MPFTAWFRPALLGLLTFVLPAMPWAASAGDSGTIEGWGLQHFDGKSDLDKAIEISKEKARLDLSANILTSVNVKTVDKTIQSGGNVQEEFKRISITKVVQVLREVQLQKPQVDYNTHVVTTKALVSKAVARQIIQECLEKLREHEAEYKRNLAKVRALTNGDTYYFKKRVLEMEDQEDLNSLTLEMDKLRKELVKEKLSDIQDVKNAVKTIFLKDFPEDDQTTFLAYIDMDQYAKIVKHYNDEVYRAEGLRPSSPYTIGTVENPDNHPDIAESVLPVMDYQMLGWGYRWVYFAGVDPEFDGCLYGMYYHAQGHFGFSVDLGFGFGIGANDIVKNSYEYTNLGYERPFNLHFPLELNGFLYLTEVKSGHHIPFLKLGVVGQFSFVKVRNDVYNYDIELANNWSGGLIFGVGATIFHKSGIWLKTLDFGLDCQWLPSGFYNEGSQVGIGFFCNFGL